MDKNKKNPLLEMPIGKSLFILSLPIIISNMLQVAYQFIDSFWVGRLGAGAVATTTLSSTIIFATISVGSGFAVAGSILIAQFYGAKNYEKVNHTAAQTLLMIIFTSVVLGMIGYFVSPHIINLMGVANDNAIYEQTVQFVRLAFLGLIFNFSFFMFQAIMRGIGKPNIPIFIVLFTVILNFLFNSLLIYGYGTFAGFGVVGSALATILSQSVACLIGFVILFSGKFGIHTKLSHYKPNFEVIKKSFFLGVPSSIEMTARSLGFVTITGIVGVFGTVALASYGVASNILQFVVILAMGLSMATSVLVGQNIGAGMVERAKKINKISAITSFIGLTIIGGLCFLFAPTLIRFFIPEDPQVVELGAHIIRIASLFFGFIGIQLSINGVLRAIGKTKIPMYLTILGQLIIKVPIAYLLSHYTFLGLSGIWWAEPITNIAVCIVIFFVISRVDWSKGNLTGEQKLEKDVIEETIIEEPIREF